MIDYQTILYSLLLLQCLLLGAYLVRERRLFMLRIFLLVFAAHMGFNLVETWLGRDITSSLAPVLSQLYGPTLFLFFAELMYADFRLTPAHAVHLVPAAIAIVLMILLGPTRPVEVVLIAVFLIYLLAGFFRVLRFHRQLQDRYSDPWGARLDWLAMIFAGFLSAAIVDGIARTLLGPGSFSSLTLQTLALALVLATLTAMVWKAMNHPRVLTGASRAAGKTPPDSAPPDAAELKAFGEAIEALFDESRLHLQPRVSVGDVADHLGLAARDVSKHINAAFEQNFSDYVNGKRVDEATALMADPRQVNRSLLQIAFDAGFNSKTAFHESFRKKTGTTPAAWRAQKRDGNPIP